LHAACDARCPWASRKQRGCRLTRIGSPKTPPPQLSLRRRTCSCLRVLARCQVTCAIAFLGTGACTSPPCISRPKSQTRPSIFSPRFLVVERVSLVRHSTSAIRGRAHEIGSELQRGQTIICAERVHLIHRLWAASKAQDRCEPATLQYGYPNVRPAWAGLSAHLLAMSGPCRARNVALAAALP
jgi:hypothetical protein